eukprot:scaffold1297_cov368-Prasinococcus_capsulatus_cf.AAC.16
MKRCRGLVPPSISGYSICRTQHHVSVDVPGLVGCCTLRAPDLKQQRSLLRVVCELFGDPITWTADLNGFADGAPLLRRRGNRGVLSFARRTLRQVDGFQRQLPQPLAAVDGFILGGSRSTGADLTPELAVDHDHLVPAAANTPPTAGVPLDGPADLALACV